MRAPSRKARTVGLGAALLVAVGLAASIPALAQLDSGRRSAGPVGVAAAPQAIVPAAVVTIDLCADEGSVTLPGPTAVDIWGFSLDTDPGPTAVCDPAALPGPVLRVTEGDVVTVNLTNNLAENVSIVFPGQDLVPDAAGAAPGGTVSYTFTADAPGTYLYEAGTNTSVQVAMGLYGALVVDPLGAPGQAYADAATAYDVEQVLVLSEIDPNLNNYPTGPNDFDLVGDPNVYTDGYHPTFFLINGEAYPDTDTIAAAAGDDVLLRFLNAGFDNHTMTLLGDDQRSIARDAYPLAHPYDSVAETVAAGSTLDTIVTATAAGSFPLYNRQLAITNGNVSNAQHFGPGGGMMTFLEVSP